MTMRVRWNGNGAPTNSRCAMWGRNPRTAQLALTHAGALRAAGRGGEAQALERTVAQIVEQAYPATSAYRPAASPE